MTTWGENFGHAIAEALQHGKPVIISDRTPWRNLRDVQAGWDLPLQESSFVAVLKNCYTMSADEYAAYSAAARTFGSAHANDPKHIDACYSLFA
jgi:glycosyltransferase involved in cell wall biosynthesis